MKAFDTNYKLLDEMYNDDYYPTFLVDKVKDGQVIGFGSGSTSYLATIAIADKIKKENLHITAIPTSLEIKLLCDFLDIPITTLNEKKPDWCFDGTDEVDENNWLIKGRGGAMFKEKLNIANSPITYILIDKSKRVKKLGEKCKIPVECFPDALNFIKEKLDCKYYIKYMDGATV